MLWGSSRKGIECLLVRGLLRSAIESDRAGNAADSKIKDITEKETRHTHTGGFPAQDRVRCGGGVVGGLFPTCHCIRL